ncbi:MAG: condensation domain-containing protein [Pseudomonadales bacterium]
MNTTPVTLFDEHFVHADSARRPMSVHIEVKVAGRMDAKRLRSAIRSAVQRHPIARARLAAAELTSNTLSWEITPELEFEPLAIIESETPEDLQSAREQLVSVKVPLAGSPPFRAYLIRCDGGDHLILNVNHAASDGIGTLRLMKSILCAYSKQKDDGDDVDPLAARDISSIFQLDDREQRKDRRSNLLAELSKFIGNLAPIEPYNDSDKAGYGLHYLCLDQQETAKLKPKKYVCGSVNDLLVAAMHLSIERWNAEHDGEIGTYRVMIPVNLRPREWWYEVFSNYSLAFHTRTKPEQRRRPEKLMRTIVEQTTIAKEKGLANTFLEPLVVGTKIPLAMKRLLAPSLDSATPINAVLSNVGNLRETLSAGDAGDVLDFWFSPPMFMSDGLGLGASGYKNALYLCFRHCYTLMSKDAIAEFANIYRQCLHSLSE